MPRTQDGMSTPGDDADFLLRRAIAGRRLIQFTYQGRPRLVEPHDYGIAAGRARLLAYQVGGQSHGPLPNWRMFDVDGMTDLTMLGETFPGTRTRAGQAHKQWDKLFCRVS
jgi:hypothetical protein